MNRLLLLTTAIFLFASSSILAQPFEQLSASIQGVGRSAVEWGDYDNDGDLDFVLAGQTTSGSYLSKIYENDNGIFTATADELQGVKDGSVTWGDFDNDNDLDILLTGETESNGNIALIYVNTDGSFAAHDAGLPGTSYGDAVWGDYDNDGDLDIFIVGNWDVALYENQEGIYIITWNDFGHLQNAKAAWGDFDNDGDLDILLTGDTGGGYFADVYLNDKGLYTAADLGMTGQFSGSADFADFDNDGDLDISISGFDIYLDPLILTYSNNGDGSISVHDNFMTGIATGSVDWGDYDNDGDLDILMCGKNAACGGSVAYVYNNDNGVFMSASGVNLQGAIRSDADWADYDNDGDLDFILSGMTGSEVPFTYVYRNAAGSNEFSMNTPPDAPTGLDAFVDGQTVTLSWERANDIETPQDALNYNLRLGTVAGGSDIITPMADVESGYRIIQALGNTNMQSSWSIFALPAGTYYWSVQTIDQAYSGSEFAAEGSFMIIATGLNDFSESNIKGIFPNPATTSVYVMSETNETIEYSIFNINGQELESGMATTGSAIDVSDLIQGVYFMHLKDDKGTSIQQLIKQ